MHSACVRGGQGEGGPRGWTTMDGERWKSRELTGDVTRVPSNAVGVLGVVSHRSAFAREAREEPLLRVSVELELMNTGPWPWTPGGAALLAGGQRVKTLRLWPPEPVHLRATAHALVVEAELTEGEARGTYTLQLWDTNGRRLVELGGVTFP